MLLLYKNRQVDFTKPVYIYRNLNDRTGQKRYSVKQKGKVVAHTNKLNLENVEFIVNLRTQMKVRQLKKKFVHAYIKGKITEKLFDIGKNITYNPYCDDFFVCDKAFITTASAVVATDRGIYYGY